MDETSEIGSRREESSEERAARRAQRRAERRARLRAVRAEAEAVPSPCIAVCQLDEANSFCVGCLRTLDEIRDWPILLREEREDLLERLAERRKAKSEAD